MSARRARVRAASVVVPFTRPRTGGRLEQLSSSPPAARSRSPSPCSRERSPRGSSRARPRSSPCASSRSPALGPGLLGRFARRCGASSVRASCSSTPRVPSEGSRRFPRSCLRRSTGPSRTRSSRRRARAGCCRRPAERRLLARFCSRAGDGEDRARHEGAAAAHLGPARRRNRGGCDTRRRSGGSGHGRQPVGRRAAPTRGDGAHRARRSLRWRCARTPAPSRRADQRSPQAGDRRPHPPVARLRHGLSRRERSGPSRLRDKSQVSGRGRSTTSTTT